MDRCWRTTPPNAELRPGFTLIELVVVLAIVALVTTLVAWSARPSSQQQLNREGTRLAIWLEGHRAQARAASRPLQARVTSMGVELVGSAPDPQRQERLTWLAPDTLPGKEPLTLTLGPEPFLPPQQLVLVSARDATAQVKVWTSGAGPWRVAP